MSTELDTNSVYTNYRRALKSHTRAVAPKGDFFRASNRKQNALKLTADRYHIPVSQVKEIVREREAAEGITHEHPEEYKNLLAMDVAYNEAIKAVEERREAGDPTAHVCTDCGRPDGDDTILRVRPIVYDMKDDYTFGLLCYPCWYTNYPTWWPRNTF